MTSFLTIWNKNWCFPFILPSIAFMKVQSYLILRCVLVLNLDDFQRQVVYFSQSAFLGSICSYHLLFSVKGAFGRSVWFLHWGNTLWQIIVAIELRPLPALCNFHTELTWLFVCLLFVDLSFPCQQCWFMLCLGYVLYNYEIHCLHFISQEFLTMSHLLLGHLVGFQCHLELFLQQYTPFSNSERLGVVCSQSSVLTWFLVLPL